MYIEENNTDSIVIAIVSIITEITEIKFCSRFAISPEEYFLKKETGRDKILDISAF